MKVTTGRPTRKNICWFVQREPEALENSLVLRLLEERGSFGGALDMIKNYLAHVSLYMKGATTAVSTHP
jgi:hypothetical protein